MAYFPKLAGIVLAGGQSSRMGMDKVRVRPFGPLGCSMLGRSYALVNSFVQPVFVSCGSRDYAPWPCLPDIMAGQGPISGIYSALKMACQRNLAGALVIGCDLPLLTHSVLRQLLNAHAAHSGQLLTLYENGATGKLEMLVAIYAASAIEYFERAIAAGNRGLHSLIPPQRQLRLVCPPEMLACFFNCNTPEELDLVKKGRRIGATLQSTFPVGSSRTGSEISRISDHHCE